LIAKRKKKDLRLSRRCSFEDLSVVCFYDWFKTQVYSLILICRDCFLRYFYLKYIKIIFLFNFKKFIFNINISK
jgi:hypothetical protein